MEVYMEARMDAMMDARIATRMGARTEDRMEARREARREAKVDPRMEARMGETLEAWLLSHHILYLHSQCHCNRLGQVHVTHVCITRTEHICADHLCHKHRRAGHMSPCRSSTQPAKHRSKCVPACMHLAMQRAHVRVPEADHQAHGAHKW